VVVHYPQHEEDVVAIKPYRVRVDEIKERVRKAYDKEQPAHVRAAAQESFLKNSGVRSPLSRPDLMQAIAELSPVASDIFDVARFYRIVNGDAGIRDIVNNCATDCHSFPFAAQHAYSALFNADPAVSAPATDPKTLPSWYQAHHKVMDTLIGLPEFKDLHEATEGNPCACACALYDVLPAVYKIIKEQEPPPDGEGDGEGESKPDNKGGKGGGKGKGKGKGQPKPDGGGGGQGDKELTQEQKQALSEALKKAKGDNDKNEAIMSGCGKEPPQDKDMDPSEYLKFIQEFKQSKLDNMLREVGRLGRVASDTAARPVKGYAGRGDRRFLGDDLALVPEYKLAELCVPGLRELFLKDMASCELPQCVEFENAPPGRGPVVLAVDESSSMSGQQLLLAKALAVATIRTAEDNKRRAWAISFGTTSKTYDVKVPIELVKFMRSNMYSGTDFQQALEEAKNTIKANKDAKMADILMLTDGACGVDDDWAKQFKVWKQRTGARVFVIIVGSAREAGAYGGVQAIADSVINIRSLNGPEAVEAFKSFWSKVTDSPVTWKELAKREEDAEKSEETEEAPDDQR
jgi:uncharacterized protein YegL